MIEIIWVVCFILALLGGYYVNTPSGVKYGYGAYVLVLALIGILGWVVFGGFHTVVVNR